eukprot:20231-Rhodomonas_salina.2
MAERARRTTRKPVPDIARSPPRRRRSRTDPGSSALSRSVADIASVLRRVSSGHGIGTSKARSGLRAGTA